MIRCLARLSKLTKKTLMTPRPMPTSKRLCQGKIFFRCQHSRNFDKELTGFKETAGCISPCSQPFYALLSLGILKITCRVLGWQIITLSLNANLQQTLMKTDIGFVLCYLKQPRQNELLFHSQINGIWLHSLEVWLSIKSCAVVSAVGWLSNADKSRGPILTLNLPTLSI